MEFNTENIDLIKNRIKEAEADIDRINENLKGMEEEKNVLETAYKTAKEDYEDYKAYYTEKSSTGLYFLVINIIVFAVILFGVLDNEMIDFFLIPSGILLVIAIVIKLISQHKFKQLKPVMEEKTKTYEEAKKAYGEFKANYDATELELEKKQYEWELVENDMIEARKDAWEAQQKLAGSN